mmetsp:Transcript_15004/g.43246  ORF Transcript_15004/g.43246 Transcript_15004/m.43246 type:complete len:341 (-) Transcript_15004:433-1455(-)
MSGSSPPAGSGTFTFMSEDFDVDISTSKDSLEIYKFAPSHLSMAMACTLPNVWNCMRSQFTNSTAETTSPQMIVVLMQPSMLMFLTLFLICTTQSLQLMMHTSCFMSASSNTMSFLPSKFSTIQFVSFCNSRTGSPLGPFCPLTVKTLSLLAGAAAAGTTEEASSFGRFLLFMSSVTFFNLPVEKACNSPKSAAVPVAPDAAEEPRMLAFNSGGGAAKPPFGGGGPLPLPLTGAAAAGAGAAASAAPPPSGWAAKNAVGSSPWNFQVKPILQFSPHQSTKPFKDSLTALTHTTSFSSFFCNAFMQWKSTVSRTLLTCAAGPVCIMSATMFTDSAAIFLLW